MLRLAALAICSWLAPAAAFADGGSATDLLARVRIQVSDYLDQFSEVKCSEKVKQEKLNRNGKVELQRDSSFDYLVILTNTGGEVSLDESRLAVGEAKSDKKNRPLLVSNGFATLFLIFHPYYEESFQFTTDSMESVSGHNLQKISFQHIHGTRSPAALALRGREYPLEISGSAWIDPQTATIAKITVTVGNTMEDVGLKTLDSEILYAPITFRDTKTAYWFPAQATVEVETPRQHWRNTHLFTDYKKFAVTTEEQVASK